MKAKLLSITGTKLSDIELPAQFSEQIRPDLIKRAVLTIQSNKRQPYGANPEAGMRHSAFLSKRRHDYKATYGIGQSRTPRKTLSRRGQRMMWVGAVAPQTVGGRRAHPPKADKILSIKINKKERRKAIRSALSANMIKQLVEIRGHKVKEYPLVVEDKAESIEKSKDVIKMLNTLGLEEELARTQQSSIRAGKGKMRGRRYKRKTGPLIVVSKKSPLMKSAGAVPGVDVVCVDKLNAEDLAPGTMPGRLTIFTKSAVETISSKKLFTDEIVKEDKK